jgi:hypothetical protein
MTPLLVNTTEESTGNTGIKNEGVDTEFDATAPVFEIVIVASNGVTPSHPAKVAALAKL